MSRYINAGALLEYWKPDQGRKFDASYFIHTIEVAPTIDLVRCKECKHWKKIIGMVGECESDYMWSTLSGEITEVSSIDRNGDDFCSYGERSEKPNNCEHITEDGVTCARYPACDGCPDNPLNKVKGSERLVKGSDPCDGCIYDNDENVLACVACVLKEKQTEREGE